MLSKLRTRFWIEIGLTILSGFLFTLTFFQKEWIEVVFRIDPDQGSGALEWFIVVGLLTMTIAFALLAHSEWRRRREATA